MTGLPIVILAGGEGRRMGGGKPGRDLGGSSLLGRTREAARRWSDVVAVAVRSPDQVAGLDHDGEVIADVEGIPGPIAGLAAALDWAEGRGADRVLVLPCDMPFLPDDLADRLSLALTPGAGAAVAASGGRLHPVCGLWRTSARAALDDQVRLNRLSLTALAERLNREVADWPAPAVDPFTNLNSPADLLWAEGVVAGGRMTDSA